MNGLRLWILFTAALLLTGCDAVAGIFKAGLWVGGAFAVLVVLAILAVFVWLRRHR